MESVKETISNLKLRASYGFTGNTEIGVYESLATLGTSNWILGNQLVSGFFPNKIPNPDLKWERTGQFVVCTLPHFGKCHQNDIHRKHRQAHQQLSDAQILFLSVRHLLPSLYTLLLLTQALYFY